MKELNTYIYESDLQNALKLIKNGKDINAKYGVGIRPIHAAINSDEPKNLEFVIKQGADVNVDQGSPLIETIDYCIDGMIQNNSKEPYPETLEMFRILLDNGADIQLKNEKGERPIDVIAAYAHNVESLDKLKSVFRPLIPNIDELLLTNQNKT